MSFLKTPVKVDVNSTHSKLGFIVKFLLIIGFILLIITIIERFTRLFNMSENTVGAIFAFSILSFGISGIFYYFRIQFGKLEDALNEFEKEDLKEED